LRNLCIAQDILPSVEEWQVYAALPATVTATSVPVQITGPFQMFIVSLNSTNSFVKLVWDRSPTADVFGYNVYYGTASRTYTKIVSAGSSTTFTAGPFVSGVTCYFAVTAYNLLGMESDFSNEVSYMIPKPFTSITLQL
jgi:fibronectin type 3 domain-containing protein